MEWMEVKIKMIRRGISFGQIAREFGCTRQYVQQAVKHPRLSSRGKRAKILARFEELLNQ